MQDQYKPMDLYKRQKYTWKIKGFSFVRDVFQSESFGDDQTRVHLEFDKVTVLDELFKFRIVFEKSSKKFSWKVSINIRNRSDEKSHSHTEKITVEEGQKEAVLLLNFLNEDISVESGFVIQDMLTIIVDMLPDNDNNTQQITYSGTNQYSSYSTPGVSYNYGSTSSYSYSYSYYDKSKQDTGYVGLKNQGATCYMNSMLQSLFHTPSFRKLVFLLPTTGNEDVEKSIPLNIQRLFCQMQLSETACSTKALTKSFGWSDHQTVVQHDVQEFCRVLLDNLEEKMKGTELEGRIASIFSGKYRSYVRCPSVAYESCREESFYDLSMLVKDTPTLQKSFEKYIEKEHLSGDNQYFVEGKGKCDAEMGIEFLSFPPVLHLHLRRFEYDYQWDRITKIDDKFEFPSEIDLDRYLAVDGDRSKSNVYQLYGILVHSGGVSAGHYYAFLRTTTDIQWFQFNDMTVTKVDASTAINNNYGGEMTSNSTYNNNSTSGGYISYGGTGNSTYGSSAYSYTPTSGTYTYGGSTGYSTYTHKKSYSGYYLVYVRKEDAPQIFSPLPDSDIPEHLKLWMEAEKTTQSQTSTTSTQSSSFSPKEIVIYPEDTITYNLQKKKTGFTAPEMKKVIPYDSSITYEELYEKVSSLLELTIGNFVIYKLSYNSLPKTFIPRNGKNRVSEVTYSYYQEYFVISDSAPYDEKTQFLFLKFFFPNTQLPIQYLGKMLFTNNNTVSDIANHVRTVLGFPKDTPLQGFEELTGYYIRPLQMDCKCTALSTGTFIIFQVVPGQPIPETSFVFSLPITDDTNNASENQVSNNSPTPNSGPVSPAEPTDTNQSSTDTTEPTPPSVTEYSYYDIMSSDAIIDNVDSYLKTLKGMFTAEIFAYSELSHPKIKIRSPNSISMLQFKTFLCKILDLEYDSNKDAFLIYRSDYYSNGPSSYPIQSTNLQYELYSSMSYKLYFQFEKNISESVLKQRRVLNVSYRDRSNTIKNSRIIVEQNSKIQNAISIAEQTYEFDHNNVKVYYVADHKIVRCLEPSDDITPQISNLLIEEQDSNPPNDGDIFVFAANIRMTQYYHSSFGDPFTLYLKPNETVAELKARLSPQLSVDPKHLKVLFGGQYPQINNNTVLKDQISIGDAYSKMDQASRTLYIVFPPDSNSRIVRREEAVKIYN